MPKLAVLGSGSWGTTFAKVLADGGAETVLWARRLEAAQAIERTRRNDEYLPGIELPAGLHATSDARAAIDGAEQVYLAVPSQQLRAVLREFGDWIGPEAIIVSLMKGIEGASGKRMSEVIAEELEVATARIAVVSGPNLALEIAKGQPTAAVVSSSDAVTARAVARRSRSATFHSFVNGDVVGTEFGGVLKNVIALAIGIVDGVGHGENTKASIITRGLTEMTDFAVAYGGQRETLRGLAGLGDLIATCGSPLSRNFSAGQMLGRGLSRTEVEAAMQQTAEGLESIDPLARLASERGVRMPILEQVTHVVAGEMSPRELAPYLTGDDEPAEE